MKTYFWEKENEYADFVKDVHTKKKDPRYPFPAWIKAGIQVTDPRAFIDRGNDEEQLVLNQTRISVGKTIGAFLWGNIKEAIRASHSDHGTADVPTDDVLEPSLVIPTAFKYLHPALHRITKIMPKKSNPREYNIQTQERYSELALQACGMAVARVSINQALRHWNAMEPSEKILLQNRFVSLLDISKFVAESDQAS